MCFGHLARLSHRSLTRYCRPAHPRRAWRREHLYGDVSCKRWRNALRLGSFELSLHVFLAALTLLEILGARAAPGCQSSCLQVCKFPPVPVRSVFLERYPRRKFLVRAQTGGAIVTRKYSRSIRPRCCGLPSKPAREILPRTKVPKVLHIIGRVQEASEYTRK